MENIESIECRVESFFNMFSQLNTALSDVLDISEENIKLKVTKADRPIEYKIEKAHIRQVFSNIDSMNSEGEVTIFDKNRYETLINLGAPPEASSYLNMRRILDSRKEDKQNALTYEFSFISDELLLFILNNEKKNKDMQSFLRHALIILKNQQSYRSQFIESNEIEVHDLLSAIKRIVVRLISLKITSEDPLSYNIFNSIGDAFIFTVSYNMNQSIIKRVKIDEVFSLNHLSKIRKSTFGSIDPPRVTYISDLIYYYETAISTTNPHLQFISFYHILEYFYEDIYNKHQIEEIRKKILSPNFSCLKPESIKEIIEVTETAIRRRGTEFIYNEQEALKLTLMEYVDTDQLKKDITAFDPELIKYYNKEVPFLSKYSVDLNAGKKNVIAQIAFRIYNVRNSVIHSKNGTKSICMPFKHDKALMMEMPLIRLIAEQVIINTSKIIDFKRER